MGLKRKKYFDPLYCLFITAGNFAFIVIKQILLPNPWFTYLDQNSTFLIVKNANAYP